MIDVLFYYIFYGSAVLIYGIGLNRTTVISRSMDRNLLFQIIKCSIAVICSTALTWAIIVQILIPAGLEELYPLIALLVFLAVTVFVEILVRITTGFKTSEFAVSYLMILLALNESTGIVDALVISSASMLSFIIILPILAVLRGRIEIVRNKNDKAKKKTLIMLSMAVLIIILAVWNVSWLNQEVLK